MRTEWSTHRNDRQGERRRGLVLRLTLTAGIGLTLLLLSLYLVAPALKSPPPPPHHWGLWVSTNARDRPAFPTPASWLLDLRLEARQGCDRPVAVRGELQIAQAYKLARSPDLIGLGVTGARVLAAEVKGITSLNPQAETGFRWRRAKVSRLRNGYVVHAPLRGRIEPNLWIGRVILFRLLVDATQEAGHASCSMSSPALFRLPGEDMLWDQASALGTAFLRDRTKMVESLYGDAIVHMAIPGRIPDRSELDAGATVHGDALLLTCHDGFDRRPPQEALEGDFYYMRTLPQQSSCASVQTFRATNATEDLNRRGFLAGALISAAISFFLLAISGRGLRTRAA